MTDFRVDLSAECHPDSFLIPYIESVTVGVFSHLPEDTRVQFGTLIEVSFSRALVRLVAEQRGVAAHPPAHLRYLVTAALLGDRPPSHDHSGFPNTDSHAWDHDVEECGLLIDALTHAIAVSECLPILR